MRLDDWNLYVPRQHSCKDSLTAKLQDTETERSRKWKRNANDVIAVDSNSALLQLPDSAEPKVPVAADHSTMIKFRNMQDKTYQDVRYKLRRFVDEAPLEIEGRFRGLYPPFSAMNPYPPGPLSDYSREYRGDDSQSSENNLMIEDRPSVHGM